MSLKHLRILEDDDDDPMLSAVNLVDVFLVLVVALLVALSIRQSEHGQARPAASVVGHAGEAGMEMTVQTDGQAVKFRGTGEQGAAQGVRAGVAYRLPDGQILYVPEAAASATPAAPDNALARGAR